MANLFYTSFKANLLDSSASGAISFPSNTIKVILIDEGTYTRSAAHQFLSDVAGGARVGTAQTLASKTTTAGVFDAADVTFTSVTGASVESILIYKDTGVEGTSPLIALVDTVSSGLPVTPNGGNITIVWDNTNGILKIG
jgi:hypothetical protein